MDQIGPKWTKMDPMDRSRSKGPNWTKWTKVELSRLDWSEVD